MTPPHIFISYRRADAAGDAGRLADHLRRRFGADRVFLDIDTIAPGTDFVEVLQASLADTAVMLAVIGPEWTSLRAADGTRRLDDPHDFVRLEVATALARGIRVVPVLVQGATLPRKEELPEPLAPLARRQVFVVDHAGFHDDAERLCDRLAEVVDGGGARWPILRRWWPAAAVAGVLALGLVGYLAMRGAEGTPASIASEAARQADALVAEAQEQRRRNQHAEALATLARARDLAPSSESVRQVREEVAMEWIRTGRVESDTTSLADAIKPALTVVDAALPSAAGARRADLLAHSGWAAFLMWRAGDRRLDPASWYNEALSIDPENPYGNAMLAHWILWQGADVPRAVTLFDTAARAGRALDAVRALQWAAYNNTRTPAADAARVRLADEMRRRGEMLNMRQAQALWSPYYFALSDRADREVLLGAVPPDDHLRTLAWAFEEYAAGEESRRQTIRYYEALLHARAGRAGRAVEGLRRLANELASSPGSLRDAVQAALQRLQRNA